VGCPGSGTVSSPTGEVHSPTLWTRHLLRPQICPSFRAAWSLEPSESDPLWLLVGTAISTISRRRLVHNAGLVESRD
jgi:hypothetical protein